MPSFPKRLLKHVGVAVVLGGLVGAVAGAFAAVAAKVSPALGTLAAAGLFGLVVAPLGIATVTWPLVSARVRRLVAVRVQDAEEPTAEESDTLSRTARGLATTAAAVGAFIVYLGWVIVSRAIQVEEMKSALELLLVAGLLFGASIASGALLRVTLPVSRFVDRKLGLPFPKAAALRFLFFVFLPTCLAILPLLFAFGGGLGVIGWVLGAVLLVLSHRMVHHALSTIARTKIVGRLGAWAQRGFGAALVGATVGGVLLMNGWPSAPRLTQSSSLIALGVGLAQHATDIDRDGASAWFGGGDCAPFDGRRARGQRDVPGNGIDEDCTGADQATAETANAEGAYFSRLQAKQKKHYNVVWVVVDSLRSASMSLYGYGQKTTPYLTSLAGDGAWVFENAFSQSTNTCLSFPSIFSGKNPTSIDWKQGRYYPEPLPGHTTFAEVATKQGYSTTMSVNYRVKRRLPGILRGHQHIEEAPQDASWKSGEYAVINAIKGIERARREKKPFVATIHFDDVHEPYVGGAGRSLPGFRNDLKGKKLRDSMVGYDRGIAQVDSMTRVLVTYLRKEGLWDETIFIFTADHGEEFEEHGEVHHATSCHTELSHVPLIMRVPKFEATRVKALVGLVDIVPTLVELLDFPKNALGADGQSLLVPVLSPAAADPNRPVHCVIFQVFKKQKDFFIHSVRSGGYVLMDHMLSGRKELFDTEKDPQELSNLLDGSGDYAPRRDAMQELLRANLKSNIFEARTLN